MATPIRPMLLRLPTRLPAHVAGELLAMSSMQCKRCAGLGRNRGGDHYSGYADNPCACASSRIYAACREWWRDGSGSAEWRVEFERAHRADLTDAEKGRRLHRAGLFGDVVYSERPSMDLAA